MRAWDRGDSLHWGPEVREKLHVKKRRTQQGLDEARAERSGQSWRARHGRITAERMCGFLYGAMGSSEDPRRPGVCILEKSLWLLVADD